MYHRTAFALCLLACSAGFSHAQIASPQKQRDNEWASSTVEHLTEQAVDLVASKNAGLRGNLVTAQGHGISAVTVRLFERNHVVSTTKTDEFGNFHFAHISPGPKVVVAHGVMQPVRIWNEQDAPPKVQRRLLVVAGSTVRAQCVPPATLPVGCNGYTGQEVLYRILQRPWLVAAGTATAIALPIALGDDDDGDRDFSNQITQPDAS